jgi:hypothetical protein
VSGCGFIQGKDGQEAVLLEFCYVVLSLLIRGRQGLIRDERGVPS